MRYISKEDLKEIISRHHDWLCDREGGERANLSSANLSSADLSSADLRYADLSSADLRYANLSSANLSSADLSSADLRYADLSYADLSENELWGTVGNSRHIKTLLISEDYIITYTKEYLQIGCERHAIKDWWKFNDDRIKDMDGETALVFWNKYKTFIKRAIKLSPAQATGRKND